MARARGSSLKLAAKSETTYGTAATGNYKLLPCFTCELSATQALTQDNVLSTALVGRDAADPNQDIIEVQGNVRVPIDLDNFGQWCFWLFGAATVVDATPDFTHTWKSGTTSLTSFTAEKGLTDAAVYFLYTGAKANTMAVDFSPAGSADATIGLFGQDEANSGSTGAGTPTVATLTRFRRNQGTVKKDGSSLANVVGGTFTFSNGLEPVRTIRSDLQLEGVDEGISTGSGTVTLRFADATMIADAIAQTPRALEFAYTLASNKSVTFTFPRVMFGRPGVPVTGPGGIEIAVPFTAAHDASAACLLSVVLKNQTAAYA